MAGWQVLQICSSTEYLLSRIEENLNCLPGQCLLDSLVCSLRECVQIARGKCGQFTFPESGDCPRTMVKAARKFIGTVKAVLSDVSVSLHDDMDLVNLFSVLNRIRQILTSWEVQNPNFFVLTHPFFFS